MATSDHRVKFHEVTKVTPFSDSTSAFSLPLTFFDTYCLKFLPVETLFFYPITDLTSDFFNSVILPKLKHSLSLTLVRYLPLAGNLMWPSDEPKPAIFYFPNDGVSVTVAESNMDFNYLSGNGIREVVEFRPLTPQLSISDDKAAVMAIQITLFPNQGFCIGFSTHHAVVDGKTAMMFKKSWVYFCNQGEEGNPSSLLSELIPFFDRTVIKDPKGLDLVYVNNWQSFSRSNSRSLKLLPSTEVNSNLVRATFELTPEDIKILRDKVLSIIDNKQSKEIHLSSYVLTCAYVYVCLVKAKGVKGNTGVIFGVVADYRSRLDPPISVNYFGNCVAGQVTDAKASDLMEGNGVAFAAKKISDLIKGIKGNVVEGSDESIVTLMTAMKQGVKFLTVAGSTCFDFYGLDFGWGRPKKMEIVSIDRTLGISLAESRDGGGGVEFGVVMEKQQMEKFTSLFFDGLKRDL